MLGATPAPSSDYYLGEATNIGAGQYQFPLPASTEDFKFYYVCYDKAGNFSISQIQQYWNGTVGLQLRLIGAVIDVLSISSGGVLKVRV
jgi:hypothetical protein